MTLDESATPEPGVNPLDTPEVREAVFEHMMRVVEAWPDAPMDTEEEAAAKRQMTGAVLGVLAPHVAAAQRAAFRAGVEAAAARVEPKNHETDWTDHAKDRADMALAIRALPVPAGFAASGALPPIAERPTEADLLWLCRHPTHSLVMVEIQEVFVPMIVDECGGVPAGPESDATPAELRTMARRHRERALDHAAKANELERKAAGAEPRREWSAP